MSIRYIIVKLARNMTTTSVIPIETAGPGVVWPVDQFSVSKISSWIIREHDGEGEGGREKGLAMFRWLVVWWFD